MSNILLFGEPMALLIADSVGPLEDVQHFTRDMSGAEVNVSIGLSRLGHTVEYLTRLGDDPFGHFIEKRLRNYNIGIENITFDPIYKTGIQLKNRVTDGSDPYAPYYRKGSAASHISSEDINKINLDKIDLVHITGIPPAISKSAREATFTLIERAKENNIKITFDPNLRPSLWEDQETMIEVINKIATNVDLIMPGLNEAKILVGSDDKEEIVSYYKDIGVGIVIIKDGSNGAYYNDSNNLIHVQGFKAKKIVDTVGAGDGFAVGVISGLVEGLSTYECVERGNAIGAIQVENISDNEGLPTREQLFTFISERNK